MSASKEATEYWFIRCSKCGQIYERTRDRIYPKICEKCGTWMIGGKAYKTREGAMDEIKKVSPKILLDTGLLFEINRQILHPFGLALEAVVDDETGEVSLGQVWDYRDDPEGILFEDKTFAKAKAKFEKFMDVVGKQKLAERKNRLGYVVQGETESFSSWLHPR